MSKPKLLPLSHRPTMKSTLQKKRPQSLVSYSSKPPPALVSPTQSPSSSSSSLNSSQYDPWNRYCYGRSSSSNKRTKVNAYYVPKWDVGTSIQDLPKVPMFHLSPPMTHLRIKGDSLILVRTGDGNGQWLASDGTVDDGSCGIDNCARRRRINPNDITSKIAHWISAMSAIGQYDSNKASAMIQTMNDITFSISLFSYEREVAREQQDDDTLEKDKGGILIDIERKKGDTIQFHWIAKSIFDSIKDLIIDHGDSRSTNAGTKTAGTTTATTTTTTTTRSVRSAKEELDTKLSAEDAVETTTEDDQGQDNYDRFQNTMQEICTLLKKDRLDASLLGMESLDLLTDSIGQSSNPQITYLASRTILVDDDGPLQFVRDEIIDLIDTRNSNCDGTNDSERSSTGARTMITRQLELKMKHYAFKILANSLHTMNTNPLNGRMRNILQDSIDEWKEILSCLVQQMKSSKYGLGTKYQIALCIQHLILMDDEIKVEAMKLSVLNLMVQYHQENDTTMPCMHNGLKEVSRSIAESFSQCR